MNNFFEQLFVRLWNRLASGKRPPASPGGLDLGFLVTDGRVTKTHTAIPQTKRNEHIAVLGKTGTGKSSLLRYMASQDIAHDRGFVFFDLHGDATPLLLRLIAAKERATGADLSSKVIVIEPGDPDFSVGLNVLEGGSEEE
jgi:DNA helicase HerA-like ATPase